MRRALIVMFGLCLPAIANAQEITVTGGEIISGDFVIKPDTVTIVVPPPVWECPPGWTCTPPPVAPRVTVRSSDAVRSDTTELGTAEPGETIYVWILMDEDQTVEYVRLYFDGAPVGTERQAPYTLGGDNSSTNILYGYVVPGGAGGSTRITSVFYFNDGSPTDSIVGLIEIVDGDTVPPVIPPDTVPPIPPDTTVTPEPAENLRATFRDGVFQVLWSASPTEAIYDSVFYVVTYRGNLTPQPQAPDADGWIEFGPIQCPSSHTTCDGLDYSYIRTGYDDPTAVEVVEYCLATHALALAVQECKSLTVTPDTTPPPIVGEIDSLRIAKMMGFAQGEQPWDYPRLADYDSVFVRYSDQFWPRFVADRDTATRSDPFIFHTYYDRMMSHYEYWWRTGDEEMGARGDEYLKAIRDWYWVPNGYIQPRRVFPEGILVHYYRTGDQLSFDTYTKLTNALTSIWWKQLTATKWLDGRVQGRVILGEIYRDPQKGRDGVDSLLAWYDRQELGPGKWSMTSYCGGQAHFQAVHAVLYAMERYNDFVSTDRLDQILPVIQATADTLWTMRNADTLFPYVSWTTNTEGSCGGEIANDLNGLLMPAFAWLYRETGDEEYRTRAALMLDAMLDHTYWTGSLGKQWNQSYWQSQRALYWLKGGQ